MNTALLEIIEIKIKNTKDTSFQELLDEIFLHKYGDQYKPIKPKHDQGCDGIIETSKTIVASYAPEGYNLEKFKRKIDGDYTSYKTNWLTNYPNWLVIYNDEIRAAQDKHVKKLHVNGSIIGIKTLVKYIEELEAYKIRKLAKYLKVDEIYLTNDFLSEILDDLLKEANTNNQKIKYKQPVYIMDKIKLNFDSESIEGAINEYQLVSEYFTQLERLISGYTDTEINSLKRKLIADFNALKGSFSERLDQLTKQYGEKYHNDDEYTLFIRTILIYIFEQCLIGKKAANE